MGCVFRYLFIGVAVGVALVVCGVTYAEVSMILTSPAFKNGESLPQIYTCDDEDISPPLTFEGIPKDAKSLVLIHDDPQAVSGVWTHWVLFNLSPSLEGLEEDLRKIPTGAKVGMNSWRKIAYGGACPPDKEHLYEFKLYALDCILPLEEGASRQDVEHAMEGHVLETALLTSSYKRSFR